MLPAPELVEFIVTVVSIPAALEWYWDRRRQLLIVAPFLWAALRFLLTTIRSFGLLAPTLVEKWVRYEFIGMGAFLVG